MASNRWLLVDGKDKYLANKIILEPVEELRLDIDYVLQVLGRYGRVEGRGVPESTLVGYRMPSSPSTRPRCEPSMLDLGDTIASHALLMRSLSFREEVRLVLEDSLVTFQKSRGLEGLRTSDEIQEEALSSGKTCCWTLSDGYMNLAKALRTSRVSGMIHDPFEPSRKILRQGRKLRWD